MWVCVHEPIVTVFQVDVDTHGIPDDGFETEAQGAVSRNVFFELLGPGDTVSVNGDLIDDAVQWKGIELFHE